MSCHILSCLATFTPSLNFRLTTVWKFIHHYYCLVPTHLHHSLLCILRLFFLLFHVICERFVWMEWVIFVLRSFIFFEKHEFRHDRILLDYLFMMNAWLLKIESRIRAHRWRFVVELWVVFDLIKNFFIWGTVLLHSGRWKSGQLLNYGAFVIYRSIGERISFRGCSLLKLKSIRDLPHFHRWISFTRIEEGVFLSLHFILGWNRHFKCKGILLLHRWA